MPKRALSRQEKTSLQLAGGLLLVVLVVSIVQAILAVVMQLALIAGSIWLFIWAIRQYNQQLTLQAKPQPPAVPPSPQPPDGPERLNYYFYQLLQEHQGQITILDFALKANLTATQAREYLDQKAREFNADFEGTERGNLVYCFETVQAWQATTQPVHCFETVQAWQATTQPVLEAVQPAALNQTQLARRLNVSPGTISRRKLDANFAQWSQTRDPAGVSWTYQPELKQFVPL